jgi:hypothetical protein
MRHRNGPHCAAASPSLSRIEIPAGIMPHIAQNTYAPCDLRGRSSRAGPRFCKRVAAELAARGSTPSPDRVIYAP